MNVVGNSQSFQFQSALALDPPEFPAHLSPSGITANTHQCRDKKCDHSSPEPWHLPEWHGNLNSNGRFNASWSAQCRHFRNTKLVSARRHAGVLRDMAIANAHREDFVPFHIE